MPKDEWLSAKLKSVGARVAYENLRSHEEESDKRVDDWIEKKLTRMSRKQRRRFRFKSKRRSGK